MKNNKQIFIIFIMWSHSLFYQTIFPCNPAESENNETQQSLIEKYGRLKLKPLYVPDPNYLQEISTTHNNLCQTNNPRQDSSCKIIDSQLLKPDQWILKSSLDNAPKLLKGIFSYLQARTHNNDKTYSITIPSFHRFILVGPPGSGKTTLAHAIAHMLGYDIVFVPATALLGHYRNETSINITRFLKEYTHKEFNIVIIIDELHKLFEHHTDDRSDDSQSAAAFWLTLDDIEKYNPNVIIIGTANNVDKLPPEIKSRFSGKIITLPLPDTKQKMKAFKNNITNDWSIILSTSVDDTFITKMIQQMQNCSLRDIRLIIDTAKMFYYAEKPARKNISPIILEKIHFQQALNQLQAESKILRENYSDKLYKKLRRWGLFISVLVNIGSLTRMSIDISTFFMKTSNNL